jgi:hypothetical protein
MGGLSVYKILKSEKNYIFIFITIFISICALFANGCSTVDIIPIVFPMNTPTNPVFTPNIVFPINTVTPTIVPGRPLLPFSILEESCSALCPEVLIGDGMCDSYCNNKECSYDGGDCNTPDMHQEDCFIFCGNSQIGDGTCDPFCNNANCNYDGGDCE